MNGLKVFALLLISFALTQGVGSFLFVFTAVMLLLFLALAWYLSR